MSEDSEHPFRKQGRYGPVGDLIARASGLRYDIVEKRYKWFPGVRKFSDLSFTDVEGWMRRNMTAEQVAGFRGNLKFYKEQHRAAVAAHKQDDVRVNVYWPKGLAEALMHDFPLDFHPHFAVSDEAVTKAYERVLGPFVISGRFKPTQWSA